jgi:hypothetical protein
MDVYNNLTDIFCCWFFTTLSILYLIFVKHCSISSSNVDVFDVLIISRIDKRPTQSLWFVEMQSGQHGLSLCEAQHITKHADHWCPECDEGLCAACENHHTISRGTRYHGIISIENYKKLPSCIRVWLRKGCYFVCFLLLYTYQ